MLNVPGIWCTGMYRLQISIGELIIMGETPSWFCQSVHTRMAYVTFWAATAVPFQLIRHPVLTVNFRSYSTLHNHCRWKFVVKIPRY